MFCKILKTLRNEKNLTQQELADKLKVAPSTIGMYESGKRAPDISTLEKLAEIFNVSTDYILGRTDNKISTALFNPSIQYEYGTKSISYEDILNYVDKHLASLPEDQRDYLVKQVNEKYWNSKNIEQKNYSSHNKKNNQ